MIDFHYLGLQNKAVRDLAWVIGSVPLMNPDWVSAPLQIDQRNARIRMATPESRWPGCRWYGNPAIGNPTTPDHARLKSFFSNGWFQKQWEVSRNWLLELDKDATDLNNNIEKKNYQRLGKYFELLIEFWLLHHPLFALRTSGLQLYQNKKTVGEVDFILQNQLTREWLHWEVAVKFYLGWNSEGDWHSWIGPNALDRLDLKIEKLLKQQLPLLSSPIGIDVLNKLGIKTIHSRALLKGGFFYPLNPDYKCIPPIDSDPQHNQGWWVHVSDLHYLLGLSNRAWKILTRLEWLSCNPDQPINQLISTKSLQNHIDQYFQNFPNSVMLAEFSEISDGVWKEVGRGFVVPTQWPNA